MEGLGDSKRSHGSRSFRMSWGSAAEADTVFSRSSSIREADEGDLKLAALEKYGPILKPGCETDVTDHHNLLFKMRSRIDRVGIELPRVEVRFEKLNVEADVHVGSRALPTIPNYLLDMAELFLERLHLSRRKKTRLKILDNVSGIIKPKRMTLLLGPPASGKTTLLLALANRLSTDLKVSGSVTYNGQKVEELVAERIAGYVSQHDVHFGEMTVSETFAFAGSCQGFGSQKEMLVEVMRRERESGIIPDPDVDFFMKGLFQDIGFKTDYVIQSLGLDSCSDMMVGDQMRRGISGGQKKRVTTGELLMGPAIVLLMDEITTGLDSSTSFEIVKHLRQLLQTLDISAVVSLLQPTPETFELFDDIILLSEGHILYQGPVKYILDFFASMGFQCPERKAVADFLQEVISKKDQQQYWAVEGQPYRYLSVKEIAKAFQSFHVEGTLRMELKVPYDKCKNHPAISTTSKYGFSNTELFNACLSREWLLLKRNAFLHIFKTIQLSITALVTMTVFFRTRMHHNTVNDGGIYLGALYFGIMVSMFNGFSELAMTIGRLPVLHKHRDLKFYPTWIYTFPSWVISIPTSLVESSVWVLMTYYVIGFDPQVTRWIFLHLIVYYVLNQIYNSRRGKHLKWKKPNVSYSMVTICRFFRQFLLFFVINQMALGLFRLMAALGRIMVVAFIYAAFSMVVILVLGGFILSRENINSLWIWGYWTSPLAYAQNAVAVNEFFGSRWDETVANVSDQNLGKLVLRSRGIYPHEWWYWLGTGAVVGYAILFSVMYNFFLANLPPYGKPQSVVSKEALHERNASTTGENSDAGPVQAHIVEGPKAAIPSPAVCSDVAIDFPKETKGMVLPFKPLSLCFKHINYYVDMPREMKQQGIVEDRLQLLHDVSGAFRPGILTALVGVSGAGKTTLMDVLAGRKTGGYIESSINISGYPKKQETFARISGYCEQNDIHSPYVTVHESLIYSALLRLPAEIDQETRKMFVKEVMELVELYPLKDSVVGLPGVTGLSTEQRKRLTIAVELVANPSIVFMDEPTSGLDARSAAIVMRTVRNIVDTGRTIVCTIHQPSIDIFEAFDELFFMKRGGRVIYAGPLGFHSNKLLKYFQSIEGVPKIKESCNPATWMLEVTSIAEEIRLGIDFAEVYLKSSLFQENMALVESLSTPPQDSMDLHFSTKYSQPFYKQFMGCLWKQHWSYWRNPQYTAVRFFFTVSISILFGSICWHLGSKRSKQQDLLNALGSMFASVLFIGISNATTVQPVVSLERVVFYRETGAGMYSALPYALAQVAIELPYVLAQALIYCSVVYSMMSLEWTAVKFIWYLFFMYSSFLCYTFFGMMTVAITPNDNMATIISVPFFMFWNLFSGLMIPRTRCPPWWKWYFRANPMSWSLYGLIASQYGDVTSSLKMADESETSVKHFVEEYFGYHHDFLAGVGFVMAGFCFLFGLAFTMGIRHLNFQKR